MHETGKTKKEKVAVDGWKCTIAETIVNAV